ncbi:Uncharacterised protein [Mycobacterium tuberculosis]|nr:Uncharacterised protein [Mycobacterium tuberculosis]CKX15944.1 Uncharacterised protein [Mycobacterium tuberculosis]
MTEPRCALTIELTMARPKPWPDPLDRDLLARTNRSKRWGRISGSMSGPSSVTDNSTHGALGPVRWQVIPMVTVTPGWVCTQALVSRLLTS